MKINDIKIIALDSSKEAHFSWRGCDNCGNRLGNDVYDCKAHTKGDHYDIQLCQDCIIAYHYGEELDHECNNRFEI